jgi:hypothetical protein
MRLPRLTSANIRIAAIALLLASHSLAAHAIPPMLPGLWELRITTTIAKNTDPAQTAQECLSQADIDHATRTLPQPDNKCTLSDIATTGNRTTYELACANAEYSMRGRMELFTNPASYDGMSDFTLSAPGKSNTPMTVMVNARRIGDCSK